MKVLFILSSFIVASLPIDPRSVNLELVTSFQIDPSEVRSNTSFVNSVRSFITQLQQLLSPHSGLRRRTEKDQKFVLTDFVEGLRVTLLSYNDAELKNVAETLCKVVQDYYHQQADFHEVFSDDNLKHFIKNAVKEWAEANVTDIRNELKDKNGTSTLGRHIEKFNNFYNDKDKETLQKILKKIKHHPPMTRTNLYNTIVYAIQFIIFERYKKLDDASKRQISEDLSKLSKYINKKYVKLSNDLRAALLRDSHRRGSEKKFVQNLKDIQGKHIIDTTQSMFANDLLDINDSLDTKHSLERNKLHSSDSNEKLRNKIHRNKKQTLVNLKDLEVFVQSLIEENTTKVM